MAAKMSKLYTHPDRDEIHQMLKDNVSHRKIVATINERYEKGTEEYISTAAISRYVNGGKDKLEQLALQSTTGAVITNKMHREAHEKAVAVSEAVDDFCASGAIQENLQMMIQLIPIYMQEGRDAREFKALAEATKIYYELAALANKGEQPEKETATLTFDMIHAAEKELEAEGRAYDPTTSD